MKQDIKYLPNDYRKLISKELGCSPSLVGSVKYQVESTGPVVIKSQMQLKILKKLQEWIDIIKPLNEDIENDIPKATAA